MRSHLEIRLEVLAREIAARKAPKIDHAANELFDQIGRKHEQKAPSDWAPKTGPAAAKASQQVEKVGTTRPLPEAAPPSAKYSVGQQWLCRDGSTAEVLQVTDYGHSRASDGWRDGCGRRTSGLNGPRDFVELIPTPDAEGWVLVTMDAPALKARQYDWKYTNRNGGTEVTPAADVSAPLRDGNLERFAQAGTYFYRVAP